MQLLCYVRVSKYVNPFSWSGCLYPFSIVNRLPNALTTLHISGTSEPVKARLGLLAHQALIAAAYERWQELKDGVNSVRYQPAQLVL